jgi:4-alpha-glucanotransferase
MASKKTIPVPRLTPLHKLSEHLNIVPSYIEQNGTERHTSDISRRALLHAVGLPADTAAQAKHSWEAVCSQRRPWVVATAVVQQRHARVELAAAAGKKKANWQVEVQCEDGTHWQNSGSGALPTHLDLPHLPQGYHQLSFTCDLAGQRFGPLHTDSQHLIVTPEQAWTPAQQLGRGKKATGIWANLYTLHSKKSWGCGDLAELQTLCRWAGKVGADFVGVNPLHALRNQGQDISPYSPTSRLFRNIIYLHIPAIAEFKHDAAVQSLVRQPRFQKALAAVREGAAVDYAAVRDLKLQALRPLHRAFAAHCAAHPQGPRARAYSAFCARGGTALQTFALYCALDAHFCAQHRTWGWQSWPPAYQSPHCTASQRFAQQHAEAVDLHQFIQFELDLQMAAAARSAKTAQMAVGLYQDLAIGAALGGAEPWVFPNLFVAGVSVGAPPDYYAPQGQDWGLPPMRPDQLALDGYAFWRTLLRNTLAHSGALRVDHILGAFRMFWIPRGQKASLGAYVRYPHNDLLGILALESHRHRALVIGEDLGTVPPEVPGVLRRWGILSSKVMYFEKNASGAFKSARSYGNHCLVTATTHDHIPIAGFATARDCTLRRQVGHLPDDAALQKAQSDRSKEMQALYALLRRAKTLPKATKSHPGSPPTPAELTAAVHRFLRRTPAPLVGLSLDDLAGETEPVNLPGVPPDVYPCWTRKLHLTMEKLTRSPAVRAKFPPSPK